MEPLGLSPLTLTVAACSALAVLMFLRLLATGREQWIRAHDLAREVQRLRRKSPDSRQT